jgi:hypothetical protein
LIRLEQNNYPALTERHMRIIAVTTCTDRKRSSVPYKLTAIHLPAGPQSVVARAWRARVRAAQPLKSATEVYCGRSFQEAVLAARAGRAEFRIVSGGLGLVRGDEQIPSYGLSLVPQSSEFIGARVTDESFDVARWWREIQRSDQTAPLAELLHANPTSIAVIGISKVYLSLIAKDLMSLDDCDLDRLRLIGMGIRTACPSRLQRCLLPYDDRLDGPDSPIRGTRTDFSSRAMRHFIESVLPEQQVGSIEDHKDAVNRSLARWRHPKSVSRPSKTDEEIIDLISKNWKAIKGKSSIGLRYLRDVENIACEQGRFRSLFYRAAKEVGS